jgi:hypothetical protein
MRFFLDQQFLKKKLKILSKVELLMKLRNWWKMNHLFNWF